MKRTSMFFPGPLLFKLKEYSQKHDLPVVDVVRRAILKFLDEEQAKEKK